MFSDRFREVFFNALAIVADDCRTITPPDEYKYAATPDTAFIQELICYASYMAEIDGKISKSEVEAVNDLFLNLANKFGKTRMKMMNRITSEAEIRRMPYALEEIIARDNQRLAIGYNKIPTSVYLYAVYFFTSMVIKKADGIDAQNEEDFMDLVLQRMFNVVYDTLKLPESTIDDSIDQVLKSFLTVF